MSASTYAQNWRCERLFVQRAQAYNNSAFQKLENENAHLYSLFLNSQGLSRYRYGKAISKNYRNMAKLWQEQNPNAPLPLVLQPYYTGEAYWSSTPLKGGGMRHNVKYLNEIERRPLQVVLKRGQLLKAETLEPFEKDVSGIFVISLRGDLYIKWFEPNKKGFFRHSSFFAGLPVLFAGYISVTPQGKVLHFDNQSGHYMTPGERIEWAKDYLSSKGFDFSNAEIHAIRSPIQQNWDSIKSMWNTIRGKDPF
ncbi:MAG: hypothetical protein KDD33_06100 [Bdellovibrionales bacterium]|nr:hypothetical protein [Bdellovibrionales bacterium]